LFPGILPDEPFSKGDILKKENRHHSEKYRKVRHAPKPKRDCCLIAYRAPAPFSASGGRHLLDALFDTIFCIYVDGRVFAFADCDNFNKSNPFYAFTKNDTESHFFML
jgi:hypothetical protein